MINLEEKWKQIYCELWCGKSRVPLAKTAILRGFGRNDTFGCTITAKIITYCALQLPQISSCSLSAGSAVQGSCALAFSYIASLIYSEKRLVNVRAVLICIFPVGVCVWRRLWQQLRHITAYFLPTMSCGCTCFPPRQTIDLKRSGFQTFCYFNETFTSTMT